MNKPPFSHSKAVRVATISNHIYYDDSDIPINKLAIKDSTIIHE